MVEEGRTRSRARGAGSTATLADVADAAGVSLATASRVLGNGSGRVVGPDLRARVLAAAEQLRYVPNANARALASASSTTVGMIVHDISDPYFAAIARGVLATATDRDLLVMICNAFRDPDRVLAYVGALRSQRVRAVLLAGSGFDDPAHAARLEAEVAAFEQVGGRVACVSRHALAADAVLPDNRGGGAAVARALLDMGHRDVAVVTGPATLTTVQDRLSGFLEEMAVARSPVPPERVVDGGFNRDGGLAAGQTLLAGPREVTAVFALNDLMAVGVLAACRGAGVRVPGDLAVVGFDDISLSRDVVPALTTVRVPMEELGARATELALSPAAPRPRTLHVPVEVVLRDSTAPRDGPQVG